MTPSFRAACASIVWLASSVAAHAAVSLPSLIAEHMVVQRGLPVHIWGKAAADETVTVTFRNATRPATADALGHWTVTLPPGEAGGPFDLTIAGTNSFSFKDVLVGDVWIASGQSNMEFALRRAVNAPAEIAAAKFPKIRRTLLSRKVSDFPLDDAALQQPWTDINPDNAGGASAVAYFFARHLQEKLAGVPIGIIETFWGGTPVESWMSLRAIGNDPGLMPIFSEWAKSVEAWPAAQAQYEKRLEAWNQTTAVNPRPARPAKPETGPGGSFTPSGLYNAMIAPLTGFAIKGAIWYQGEANANNSPNGAALYARAFQGMIRDWRRAWGEGDFPFFFVQLANLKANTGWPELREAQRQTLALANTGMAVTIDIGNPTDVHPTDKQDVGLRLALAARAVAFGEKIEYSGPAYRQAAREGSALRVWFDHTAGGMVPKSGPLKGFEIAGADGKFIAADAKIEGASIVVSTPTVSAPVAVRYAWADNPDGNLFNGEGLPASPFRSQE